MKSLFIATAAAALIFSAPAAFADPPDHQNSHHGKHDNDSKPSKPAKPAKPAAKPAAKSESISHSRNARRMNESKGRTTTNANPATVYQQAVRKQNQDRNNNRSRDNDRNRNNDHNNHNWNSNNHDHDRNTNRNDHNWNNNNNANRGHDRDYWRSHFNRRNVTAQHHYRYRGRSWSWPNGYRYQRWTFGMTLPSIFWGDNYWIDDYYDYGLAPPPPGTVWVRYGDDAILIDRYSGEVLEVVYDQFD